MKVYIVKTKYPDSDEVCIHSIWDDIDKANECRQSLIEKQDSSLDYVDVLDLETHDVLTKDTNFAPYHTFIFKQTGELVRHETGDKRIEDTRCWTHKYNDIIPHDPEVGGCINVFVITDYENAKKLAKEAFENYMKKIKNV